jgi:hypothetical protein
MAQLDPGLLDCQGIESEEVDCLNHCAGIEGRIAQEFLLRSG